MPVITTLIQHHSGGPSQSNKQRKRQKKVQGLERNKAFFFHRWHDCVDGESKRFNKVLEINEVNKVSGYKVMISKSSDFYMPENNE